MAKSFFERITGSIKMHGEETSAESAPEAEETKPVIAAKPSKQQRGRRPSFKAVLAGVKEIATEEPSSEQQEEKSLTPTASDEEENNDVSFDEEKQTNQTSNDGNTRVITTSVGENEGSEDGEDGQLTIDVYDDGSHFVAQSAVAGVRPEDVEISVADNTLTIKGLRRRAPEVNHDRFYAQELYWGKFSRAVALPEDVDDERTEALLKNGLLTVRIAKKPRENTKKIRVRSE
ncbi:MAG: Hsp20/alpha crystallin family protein [Candidatus Sungbacteria bacterium]|nr:Hsp20/alpha crystallin family protein [Candidatus Sungbacteria bacterium]